MCVRARARAKVVRRGAGKREGGAGHGERDFDLMRTGDTASYLLHDFFVSLVCFASASYCIMLVYFYFVCVFFCVFVCVEIIIYNFI